MQSVAGKQYTTTFFSLDVPLFPKWDYNKQNFKKFLVQEQDQNLDPAQGRNPCTWLLSYTDLCAATQL